MDHTQSGLVLGPAVYARTAQATADKAWTVLQAGLADKTVEERAVAVRMLGLLENDPKATDLALKGLQDQRPKVRTAARLTLLGK